MSPIYAEVCHEGRWLPALVLHQYRTEHGWRVVIRYTVAPGMTYQLGVWADELRPVCDLRE